MALTFGLTGGIATGKSTVAKMMVERGALLIDADKVAREVVEPGTEGLKRLVEHFGQQILCQDGRLHRKRLAEIVFADAQALQDLNRITHPLIRKRMKEKAENAHAAHPQGVVVMDIPLLIEGIVKEKLHRVDRIILVYVPEEVQLARLMERDGMDLTTAKKRLAAQMPIEQKLPYADEVIHNSGTIEETQCQVERLMDKLYRLVRGEAT